MGKHSLERMPYPSDVTDEEWELLEPLLPGEKPEGRPQEIERREIVNAILYVLRGGCRLSHVAPRSAPLVHGLLVFPPMETGGDLGTGQCCEAHEICVSRWGGKPNRVRRLQSSQSVKTSSVRGDERGYDAGEKNSRQKTVSASRYGGGW